MLGGTETDMEQLFQRRKEDGFGNYSTQQEISAKFGNPQIEKRQQLCMLFRFIGYGLPIHAILSRTSPVAGSTLR